MEEERRAEDAATEGGRTAYEDGDGKVETAADVDEPDDQEPGVRAADGSIGDPKYQAGGLATGERGRQSGARIESGQEEQGEPSEDEL